MKASRKSQNKRRTTGVTRSALRLSLVAARGSCCQFPDCTEVFSDMHEVLSRGRGGSPVDPENILLLCREHHHTVTVNPSMAEAAGLSRARTADEHRALYRPWET